VREHGEERVPLICGFGIIRCMGIRRLSHAVYETRYHLVWAPKYGKWILKDEVRESVEELFKEILAARDCEVVEMEIAGDHVHIFTSIPPKYSVGEMVRVLKSVSAKEIFRRYPEVKRELWGGEFWEDGYFVRTVGDKVTSDVIKKYIEYHRHEEKTPRQLKLDF
jgi:putative transposase